MRASRHETPEAFVAVRRPNRVVLLAALALSSSPLYEAVELRVTLREMSRILINARGTIVGTRQVAKDKFEGFVYQAGRLMAVEGAAPWAGGLNGRDEAVFMGPGKIILWKNGRSRVVVRSKAGRQAGAAGIDNAGNIVGSFYDLHEAGGGYGVFFYPPRKHAPFEGKGLEVARINNAGQMVYGSPRDRRMYFWSGAKSNEIRPPDPDVLLQVTGLNDAGEVVGEATARTPGALDRKRAFRWSEGRYSELPVFTPNRFAMSKAEAVDNHGRIVGSCNWMLENGGDAGPGPQRVAVLWADGQIYDLNKLLISTPSIDLYDAVAINDEGQIVALGQPRGRLGTAAYLLNPTRNTASPGASGR